MGPRTYDLNLLATGSSWCSTTLRFLLETSPLVKTCPRSLCTFCAPFPSWPLPTPTSVSFPHQVMWPLALPHLHHPGVVLVLPKSWAQLVTCPSPFERGWTQLRSVPSYYNKIRPTPSGPPNLVDPLPHNSLGIFGSPSSPSWFVHRFGDGTKCSSWVPTPCASTRLAKTCLWTLGLYPTLSFGRPWCLKMWEKNNLPVSWAVASSLVGMKCAILLNQSTTTMMASNPLDGGKFTMKSMDTLSHGPSGIGKGCNKPACFLLRVQFCWQVKQVFTYSSTHSFQLGLNEVSGLHFRSPGIRLGRGTSYLVSRSCIQNQPQVG